MATPTNKRPVMTLYSASSDMDSHRVRIVLAEKGVFVDVIEVDRYDAPIEDLNDLNPYNEAPTLVDRDLVLYNARIIMEYLDERFPHPPLLPVYPVLRAKSRLMIYRIERDWSSLVRVIEREKSQEKVEAARVALAESLTSLSSAFAHSPYFFSEEFSLIDCTLAPILWRLPALGVGLPKQARPVLQYAEKIFRRPAFVASLTEAEQELRLG